MKYILTAIMAVLPFQGWAADTIDDATYVAEPAPIYDTEMRGSADVYASGFYIRGAAGWVHPVMRGIDYRVPYGWKSFNTYDLNDSWAVEGALGYQINRFLRTELSLNYIGSADFNGSTSGSCGVAASCVSTDTATWSAYSLMASAYVDFDFWGASSVGIVPYVGAGIGGSYVNFGSLKNQSCETGNPFNCDPTYFHEGKKGWRFSYQLTAGLSYGFRCDLVGDAYYRYQYIDGGDMFGYQAGGGPGYDKGIDVHSVMAGLRFYPGRDCSPAPYVPPEPIVYK